jgi:hypothetical protein
LSFDVLMKLSQTIRRLPWNERISRSFKSIDYRKSWADGVWNIVVGWDSFARDTVGKQIVRAADSIGANISEGSGRGSLQDNR